MVMYNPPHPGLVVRRALIDENGLSITEAANLLDVSRLALSRLINGYSGISPEMAVRLSIALNTSSEMWANMQLSYNLWIAEKKRQTLRKRIKRIVTISQEKKAS